MNGSNKSNQDTSEETQTKIKERSTVVPVKYFVDSVYL